jgi:proliferating cell nuclear antigen PCNA
MKFSATLKATKEFKSCLSAIQLIIEDATFEVTPTGIKCKGIEPSNICYMSIDLPKDKFIKYECDTDSKFTVRTNELMEIVKRAKNGDEITLEMDGKLNALQIYINGKKHYVLPLLVMEKETPNPNFKLQSRTSLKFADFVEYVKDIKVIADNFVVETDGVKLKLSGKGDSGHVDMEVDGTVTQKEEGDLRGEYMLEFLFNTIKTISGGFETVILEHGHNLPLKLTFDSADTGTLVYVQAPKVL